MKRAIREHRRDFLAIIGLLVISLAVSAYILTNQRLTLPAWVPVIGKDFYEFNGDFSTAQAVTPGQGQTVVVAGVNVGEISRVDLVDGKARLRLRLDDDAVVVRRDATMLLRPKTGLRDMTVQLDPGSADAPRLPEGGTIPVAQTQPDVGVDELLAALDADTRTYLQLLLNAGAEGLEGHGEDLGDTLRTFKPGARALRQINEGLAERRETLARVIHNLSLVSEELGDNDDQLARFVTDSNAVLSVFARQEANIRASLRELPSTLDATQDALTATRDFAGELGPSLQALRPAARNLGPALRQVRPFLRESPEIIRESIRPLVREARPLVGDLRPTLRRLSAAQPDLTSSFRVLNRAVNGLAFNPPGDEEGFLFWLSWGSHITASLFSTQDAHGPVRRGVTVVNCTSLVLLDSLRRINRVLGTTIELVNIPRSTDVCGTPGATGVTP
jgi:phospholipid/cholesterol/gamma-HCH transport system substrate-binding protein